MNNNMCTAILIDDERNALDVLEMQLKQYCTGVTILAKCDSGEKGIEAIRKLSPALVFLDVEMPYLNGFEVLEQTSSLAYQVIFTTAYDQFAIKAFKYSAIDYLLKPIDIVELQQAVKKAQQSSDADSLDCKLKRLLNQIQPQKLTNKIALPIGEAFQFVEPNEIIRCESESNYTHIFLTNGKKITLAKTLKEVEENIQGSPFYRIHQSHLINMNHIVKFTKGDGAYVVMNDGTLVTVSRQKKEAFMETFKRL
jgi:two-component system, LytTR family, response regulator